MGGPVQEVSLSVHTKVHEKD